MTIVFYDIAKLAIAAGAGAVVDSIDRPGKVEGLAVETDASVIDHLVDFHRFSPWSWWLMALLFEN